MAVPLVVACAFFMENFDATVITTALPDIGRSLGVSPIAASNGVTAYLVGMAVFIPVSGWLADRFGARTVFRAALAVYGATSAMCALSFSLNEFILARALQGASGAMMIPVGRLIVLRAIERRHFVRAMSWVTTPALVSGVIGPPIGGFLATYASWRWIFAINIAVGLLGVVLVSLVVAPDRPGARRPLDWQGFVLGAIAASALMIGLQLLAQDPTRPAVAAGFLAVGLAAGAWCIAHSRRIDDPLVGVGLFRITTFRAVVEAGSLFAIAAIALLFLLPILFQVGFGMTSFESGMLTLALAVGALAMKVAAPMALRRFGFRTSLVANSAIVAACCLACALFTAATPLVLIAGVLLILGFARSLQFAALNSLCFSDVPDRETGAATSLFGTSRQIANGLGVALSAAIMQLAMLGREGDLAAADIRYALGFAGVVAMLAALLFLRLDARAGAHVSGHGAERSRGAA